MVRIEVGGVHSSRELHGLLQEALRFPDWYGHNWDAFWDSITGLVEMPRTLELVGWAMLAQRLPRDAQQLKDSLEDMGRRYPNEAAQVVYA